MKNIYLTGMPGCGKTTVAKLLSKELQMPIIDMDSLIVEKCGQSINDIFSQKGEAYFRQVESEVLSELSKTDGNIVSTGGGIIKLPQNIKLLKTGTVVFIDVPPEVIAMRGDFNDRPLLKDNIDNLNKLYSERYEIYKACADVIVLGTGTPYTVAQRILSFVNER